MPADSAPPAAPAPNWFGELPAGLRIVLQGGAVCLVMYLYTVDSREKAGLYAADSREKTAQIARLQEAMQKQAEETRAQAREDRTLFRETMATTNAANDRRSEALAVRFELVIAEMNRVLSRIVTDQAGIKRDVSDLKFGGPESFKAPPPRAVPEK